MSNVHKEIYSQTSLRVHVLKRGIQVSLLYIYGWIREWARWNSVIWLATRAGKLDASRPLGISRVRPVWKRFLYAEQYNKSLIKQACLVNMAGYWPRLFFLFFLRFYRPRLNLGPLKRRKNVTSIQPFWLHAWPHGEAFFLKCQLIVAFQFIIKRIKKLYILPEFCRRRGWKSVKGM